jgi:hypothetical protein
MAILCDDRFLNASHPYTKSLAKAATIAAGMGYDGPEILYRTAKFSFYHYHTANRNGVHCLYGLPNKDRGTDLLSYPEHHTSNIATIFHPGRVAK